MNKENKNGKAHLGKRGSIIPAKTMNFNTICKINVLFNGLYISHRGNSITS